MNKISGVNAWRAVTVCDDTVCDCADLCNIRYSDWWFVFPLSYKLIRL